ncbi:MAG: diphosphomevalonate decarboxylase [Flavobacteriaceae bacterium TMED81]|nr:MAG: diphosphomevalonate decarboxylase [Flavobacteriaceae bacterium TMED81]|tara:strand:+ start:868 stop:1950 length:1083 start_codon:yes stop_codon:yes gene_type:complete
MNDNAQFVPTTEGNEIPSFQTTWSAPSNIALVKYWGKKELQIPCNPSVSFTLDQCRTTTSVRFERLKDNLDHLSLALQYDGKPVPSFEPKVKTFIDRILPYAPYLKEYHLLIDTINSFPHSSGIASSASAMSALAAAIMDLEKQIYPSLTAEDQIKKCSFLARLGSGSSARSVEGPLVLWGEHTATPDSSDLFGVRLTKAADVFKTYHDTILLVDKGQKEVSSTIGHNLMHNHPFAENRFTQAKAHYQALLTILEMGDMDGFNDLVEREALSLHAMMLTSSPSYILMHPNTIQIIQEVRRYRKTTGLNLTFTLDAGANVHLLYPAHEAEKIDQFIASDMRKYCQDNELIYDRVGTGLKKV